MKNDGGGGFFSVSKLLQTLGLTRKIFTRTKLTAFTLAEVLITLGIIGIIAAMTLPGLMADYRIEVLKAEYKKVYNELQQINLMFIKDEGLNICEYNWMLVDSGVAQMEAAKQTTAKMLDYYQGDKANLNNKFNNDIKTLTGGAANVYMFDDGNMWNFLRKTFYVEYGARNQNKCMVITVDINGYYQRPNQLGVDMFSFRPTKNGGVIPLGSPQTSSDAANGSNGFTECSMNSESDKNGMGCAFWASIDVNPDDKSKGYWKEFIKY